MTRFLTFLAVCISCGLNAQASYYVSPTGDNSDNGTLFDPFLTINHALSLAVPGTTIYLMGGTYSEVIFMPSGTSSDRITLTKYGTQVPTLVSPAGNTNAIINIVDANYITIKGLEITGYAANDARAIQVEGVCAGISIINNAIHDIHFSTNPNAPVSAATNAQPIIVYGTNPVTPITGLRIESNLIYDCRTGFSEAVAVNGNVSGFTIDHNIIYNITNIGIDAIGGEGTCPFVQNDVARNGVIRWNEVFHCVSAYATSAGIYTDGASDVVIENNTVYECGWGIEVGCENAGTVSSNIKVRNNIVFHNLEGGIVIGGYDYPVNSGKVTNSVVQQNTIVNNNTADSNGEVIINYTENCTFNGNIVYNTTTSELMFNDAGSINLSCNYNCYYAGSVGQFSWNGNSYSGLANWQSASGVDANSMEREPLLVNISTLNFHMSALSPCIDSGDVAFVADPSESDMDTSTRLQNGRVDIGADEYGTAVGFIDTFDDNRVFWHTDYENDQFTIRWKNPLNYREEICLLDVTGKVLSSHEMCYGDQVVTIYFGGLPPGTYYAFLRGRSTVFPIVVPD
ncbi:MAG TPA: right-handed parallel beta-helix repeat-containing protein [Bacteroidia bacterium]|nr:right-handed parallel beta-helix repeat-containing protein [Bacteroidia bacterium]